MPRCARRRLQPACRNMLQGCRVVRETLLALVSFVWYIGVVPVRRRRISSSGGTLSFYPCAGSLVVVSVRGVPAQDVSGLCPEP